MRSIDTGDITIRFRLLEKKRRTGCDSKRTGHRAQAVSYTHLDVYKRQHQYCDEQNKILNAVLTCVEPPSEVQLNKMKAFLCEKYDAVKADIEIIQDKALLGGFVLRVGLSLIHI